MRGDIIMKINKNEMIITIDSEPGCNGDWIGKRMSRILGIPCYGKEILDRASEISGISRELMTRYDGRPVIAAYDFLAEDESALRIPPAKDFITAQVFASRNLAEEGPCILVDRHATAALEGDKNHISIYIHADIEDRAKVYADQKKLDRKAALHALKKLDRVYRNYYKGNNNGWGDADHYDLTVNASDTESGDTAEIIVHLLETLLGVQLRKQTGKMAV